MVHRIHKNTGTQNPWKKKFSTAPRTVRSLKIERWRSKFEIESGGGEGARSNGDRSSAPAQRPRRRYPTEFGW